MLISTLDELRLFSPSNAFDNIESLSGFISSSEFDFLKEKLGDDLYNALVDYYFSYVSGDIGLYISMMQGQTEINPFGQLLYLSQKVVTFDALSRAVSVQAISINGAGVNVASADDYKAADSQAIADFKKACVREAHSAVNELLQCLEQWTIVSTDSNAEGYDIREINEIATRWKGSRYYYLVTSLLIPSAKVLQEYYNIYESREKFIQLLPDLRWVQEDIISPIYSDDFIEYFTRLQFANKDAAIGKHQVRILHYLRKIMVRHLETRLLKPSDARFEAAHNEAIKLTARLNEYILVNQNSFDDSLTNVLKTTNLFVCPENKEKVEPKFKNNGDGAVIFVTPGLM